MEKRISLTERVTKLANSIDMDLKNKNYAMALTNLELIPDKYKDGILAVTAKYIGRNIDELERIKDKPEYEISVLTDILNYCLDNSKYFPKKI